ncbi:MAG: DNA-directed RNA polymerase subunit beta', partial [Ruthenibacterium sp.]
MYQCGLPKEMALELFKPFVMKDLVEKGLTNNIKGARKMVERTRTEVWDSLETVIKGHPVLLNRAPTLHRLGIQAFEPVLVEGRAIKLHPLVCTAYNADFDGDQMAVHVPLSEEAQHEARTLMLASNNLLKPSDGKPVTVPSQDMVLGSYYLTMADDGEKGEGKVFRDENEAVMAYQEGVITLHAKIKVRREAEIDGELRTRIIDTTVGRLIFNQPIPQDIGFIDRTNPENAFLLEIDFLVGKKQLGLIIERCIHVHGTVITSEMLDKVKAQGYKYSTKSAITVAVSDAVIPPQKPAMLADAEEQILKVTKQYNKGLISNEERYNGIIKIWNKTTEDVSEALSANLDSHNPIFMMADSGARGSMAQIRQLAGMRGLIANTSGKTIEIPIRANYREGLNILEYFIAGKGARKGLADTALRTADSGYLTRRLVDVSQDVIIREEDCGATEGLLVSDIREGNEIIEKLEERLQGRYSVHDIVHPETGELLVSKENMMTEDDAKKVVAAGVKVVELRTVLCCIAKHGVCSKCYGANLANGRIVGRGEAVGIIAAQSIGEPGTQLTMRTFHTGGIASAEDITQGLPRVEELFEARRPKNLAIMTEISGTAHIDDTKKNRHAVITGVDENNAPAEKSYLIPFGQRVRVNDGDLLEKGDIITEGFAYPQDILAIKGPIAVQNYLISEVQKVYRLQGVDICDKHIEVIVLQMMRKIRVDDGGSTGLIAGSSLDKAEFRAENAKISERIANGEADLKFAEGSSLLLGITKASLATDSFLSAASFQETTRVLTDAAIKGKVDPLRGLKENVIIGKLIPAGTGLPEVEEELLAGEDLGL